MWNPANFGSVKSGDLDHGTPTSPAVSGSQVSHEEDMSISCSATFWAGRALVSVREASVCRCSTSGMWACTGLREGSISLSFLHLREATVKIANATPRR